MTEDRALIARYDYATAEWIPRGDYPDTEPEATPAMALSYDVDLSGRLIPVNRDYCLDIEIVNLSVYPRWLRFVSFPLHVRRLREQCVSLPATIRMAWMCIWA